MAEEKNSPNIIFLGFADNRIPEFKEVKSKDWIYFGEDNCFPEHLLYLFNKSSNHNAIINGKVTYILGKGFTTNNPINLAGEKRNKVFKKAVTDGELNGGFYLQAVWTQGGKIASFTHMPFQYIRKAKDKDGYYYSKDWYKNAKQSKKIEPQYIPPFDPSNPVGAQLFAFQEYRPGCDTYPLPGYFGALNDIETDVEISKYNLSVIKNGMFSSKMIIFNNGTPTPEVKRKLEKDFEKKFTGAEAAGKFMLVFNEDPAKAPIVQDLSTTDLDKLFDQLNKTTQAEIFSGHQVTSPMLFGIKEAGQLGGRNEIQDAYEIFKNTYINDKQMAIEEVADFLAPFMNCPVGEKIIPVEPLGVKIDPVDFKEMLPKEWVLEQLNIDPLEYPDTNPVPNPQIPGQMINEHLKNLTGRQAQNIERIIKKYKTGRIPRPMAETMLKSGLGLDDNQISTFLNFSLIDAEDEVSELFETIGEKRENFNIIKTKQKFESEEMMFKDIKGNDSSILDLIRKDKRVTPQVIADTINESVSYVNARIKALTEAKIITPSTEKIGVDTIIEHAINPEMIDNRTPPETADVFIRYSYEVKPGIGPAVIPTTRPFCKRLIELDRLYTRSEIQSISQRVGFSVWDRKGGFWGDNEECRHRWVSHIVIKKR